MVNMLFHNSVSVGIKQDPFLSFVNRDHFWHLKNEVLIFSEFRLIEGCLGNLINKTMTMKKGRRR